MKSSEISWSVSSSAVHKAYFELRVSISIVPSCTPRRRSCSPIDGRSGRRAARPSRASRVRGPNCLCVDAGSTASLSSRHDSAVYCGRACRRLRCGSDCHSPSLGRRATRWRDGRNCHGRRPRAGNHRSYLRAACRRSLSDRFPNRAWGTRGAALLGGLSDRYLLTRNGLSLNHGGRNYRIWKYGRAWSTWSLSSLPESGGNRAGRNLRDFDCLCWERLCFRASI